MEINSKRDGQSSPRRFLAGVLSGRRGNGGKERTSLSFVFSFLRIHRIDFKRNRRNPSVVSGPRSNIKENLKGRVILAKRYEGEVVKQQSKGDVLFFLADSILAIYVYTVYV